MSKDLLTNSNNNEQNNTDLLHFDCYDYTSPIVLDETQGKSIDSEDKSGELIDF